MSKKELLSDIVHARNGLTIEKVFGEVAWAKFQELQAHDVIVVCGNGPVRSFHGEFIENAKLVIRCNHYLNNTSRKDGQRKIGRKCDVQFVCLHGGEFKKAGLKFLHDWCRESKVVLALEITKARQTITSATEESNYRTDPILSKICLPSEDFLPKIFARDCTRGFYAIAFALQAKQRLLLSEAVRCIGFGRKGHEGVPQWRVGHGHHEEMLLWIEM